MSYTNKKYFEVLENLEKRIENSQSREEFDSWVRAYQNVALVEDRKEYSAEDFDFPKDGKEQHVMDCIRQFLLDDNVKEIKVVKKDNKAEIWIDQGNEEFSALTYTGRHLYK